MKSAAPDQYLRRRVPLLLDGCPAVRAIVPLDEDVWRIDCADGRRLVAKQQLFGRAAQRRGGDLLALETGVLQRLKQAGCPVPAALGTDPQTQFIFLEYCGDRTLDDVAQEETTDIQQRCVRQTIAGFCAIDQVFQASQQELLTQVAPGGEPTELAENWKLAGIQACRGLSYLLKGAGSRFAEALQRLAEILTDLAHRPPRLGSTDYNARNVVVDLDRGQVSFIEFAKIGWDWPERRLLQYTTSLGANRRHGNVETLLTPDCVAAYTAAGGEAAALDRHRLVFLLNAVARLDAALEKPEEDPGRLLLKVWQNPTARVKRLQTLLAVPLSDDWLAGRLRACMGPGRPIPTVSAGTASGRT
jgi:hypothetical protein